MMPHRTADEATRRAALTPTAGAVSVSIVGAAATVTIGSGLRSNVLAPQDWQELERVARELATREDLAVVVIRGVAGTFSAGSDLRYWDGAKPGEVDADFASIESALQAVERLPIPTIAVVEGIAAGGSCELALACDLRLFADTARIGMPVVQLGVLVSPHFILRMTLLIGVARARELLYSGRLISAREADRMGMANAVVPAGEMEAALAEWIGNISRQPRSGLVAAKAASTVALEALRRRHQAPGWKFSDPGQLQSRITAFFRRTRH